MSEETDLTLDLDPDLRRQLVAEAEAEDRTLGEFVGAILRDHVSRKQRAQGYDACFDAEIEQALREADDPRVIEIPDDIFRADLERRMASLRDRI